MSNESEQPGNSLSELELARLVRELPEEMAPERDLWRGIERQIMDAPQPETGGSRDWMPWGVAASFLVATAALVLNLAQVPGEQTLPVQDQLVLNEPAAEYRMVRDPMVEQFQRVNSGLQPATRNDLMRNLDILREARRNLEQDLELDPGNQRARQMLIRLHEQELALLKQDYLGPARSL